MTIVYYSYYAPDMNGPILKSHIEKPIMLNILHAKGQYKKRVCQKAIDPM